DFPLARLDRKSLEEMVARFPSVGDVYPLSPIQQLYYSMDAGTSSPGFEQLEFLLKGPVDADRLRHAWDEVVARHSILRTAFATVGSAEPHQAVLDIVALPWHADDRRGLAQDDRERRIATPTPTIASGVRRSTEAPRRRRSAAAQPALARLGRTGWTKSHDEPRSTSHRSPAPTR